jgi:hypothetical protein
MNDEICRNISAATPHLETTGIPELKNSGHYCTLSRQNLFIFFYIRNIEEKGECTDFHNTLKNMVTNSMRSEKLRLGMW